MQRIISIDSNLRIKKVNDVKKQKNYAVLFFLATVFLGASLLFYLSTKSSDLDLSDNSINLYDLLESKIDHFLLHQKRVSIAEAKDIASLINTRHNDSLGLDTVSFYSLLPKKQRESMAVLRQRLFQLESRSPSSEKDMYLQEANLIAQGFLSLGNRIGWLRTQILIVKYYSVMGKRAEMRILADSLLQEVKIRNYIFFQCHLLLWQAKADYNKTDLVTVRKLSEMLHLSSVYTSASSTLVGLYEISGDNQKAIETAEEVLAKTNKHSLSEISLLQSLAIALAKQGDTREALKQIDISMSRSTDTSSYSLGLSQIIKALILERLNDLSSSNAFLDLAAETATRIDSNDFKYQLLTMCEAYRAKIFLKESKKHEALSCYHRALGHYAKMEIQNNFVLAQLNQGVAQSIDSSVLSQYYSEAAGYNLLQAEINKDKKYSPFFNYN